MENVVGNHLPFEHAPQSIVELVRETVLERNKYYVKNSISGKSFELYDEIIIPELAIEDSRILEVGVGYGQHLLAFAETNYWGVDVDEVAIKCARRNAHRYGIAEDRLLATGKHYPFDDEFFDRIIAVNALHEFDDVDNGLEEIHRLTAPGGHIMIVERFCAIDETPQCIENLKSTNNLLPWFAERNYAIKFKSELATYWGESLSDYPQFTFQLLSAVKL